MEILATIILASCLSLIFSDRLKSIDESLKKIAKFLENKDQSY